MLHCLAGSLYSSRLKSFARYSFFKAWERVTLGRYCCEARIEEFKEPQPDDKEPITRIRADISVERDSQKGIIAGKGGAMIKDVGSEVREKLEEFLQEKVFLSLDVRVKKNCWKKDEKKLKSYGYVSQLNYIRLYYKLQLHRM